ncbi:MAG: NAD(P)H-dependent oxidoreductase [Bacteroidota bacterium]
MAKILAFAGSNSSQSINFQLVKYTTTLLNDQEIQLLNMAHYPFPMFSEDVEHTEGYSNSLVELREDLRKADGVVLSVNEHNRNPSAYFKNLVDWLSRLDRKFLNSKKVLLMATSNGKWGATGAMEISLKLLQGFGAEVVATFSLPGFKENFIPEQGIANRQLSEEHAKAVATFLKSL